MSQRMVRVNELVRREIGDQLRKYYGAESVGITITRADVSPDLRSAKIFFSTIGGGVDMRKSMKFLNSKSGEFRHRLGKTVKLKFTPSLEFYPDHAHAQATDLLYKMEEIEREDAEREGYDADDQ